MPPWRRWTDRRWTDRRWVDRRSIDRRRVDRRCADRRWVDRFDDDSGSASLEFVTTGLILLVPLVYLVLVMSALQSGSFAAEGAARQAARVYVQSSDRAEATAAAQRAVEFAFDDYGIDPAASEIRLTCAPDPAECLTREGSVTVTVAVSVALPLVPTALDLDVPLSIPLEASATQQVSRFWRADG